VDLEELIGNYIALRDKRAALKKKFTEKDDTLKAAMSAAEAVALERMEEIGAASIRTGAGTVFKETKRSVTTADVETFFNYVRETESWDMIEKRPARATVLEWADEHGTLPPGLNLFSELTIKIRRS
jgi:hypothetical protein